jgi:hypothetical protein
MNTCKEWKWSIGEGYYKSARFQKESNQESNQEANYESPENAIKQSLAEDTNVYSAYENDTMNDTNMISITNSVFSRSHNDSGTRREDLDTKMSDRGLTQQRGTNPFMGQTSYVNDVVTRDMFLKPVNTTQGEKKKNNSESNENYN